MEAIFNELKDIQWKKINIIFNINGGAIGYDKIEYIDEYGTTNSFWIKFKLIDNLLNLINNQYNQSLNDVSKRFNKYQIEIFSDGETIENKWWDSEKDKQDLLKGAEVVFQWANDRMMSMIFEFEKENNLLPTLILRAGSTKTSQRRCSALSSLNKKTSIRAPVFSLFP